MDKPSCDALEVGGSVVPYLRAPGHFLSTSPAAVLALSG